MLLNIYLHIVVHTHTHTIETAKIICECLHKIFIISLFISHEIYVKKKYVLCAASTHTHIHPNRTAKGNILIYYYDYSIYHIICIHKETQS